MPPEYIVAAASDLAPKPRTLDFDQAAAIPLSALTGWQGLFDYGILAPGQNVLIHGAAGGVGSFAVQLANWRGAHVIGTASTANLPFLRTIGAHETIDYEAVRFEDVVHDVDVVLDTVGGDTLERSWPVVRHGGVIVTAAGEISEAQTAKYKYGVHGVSFIVKPSRQELIKMKELIDGGLVRPIVSAVFPLAQARRARHWRPHPRQAGPRRSTGIEANAIVRRGRALSLAEANSRLHAASLISRRGPIRRQPQTHVLRFAPEGFWGRDATNVTPRRW